MMVNLDQTPYVNDHDDDVGHVMIKMMMVANSEQSNYNGGHGHSHVDENVPLLVLFFPPVRKDICSLVDHLDGLVKGLI